MLKRHFPSLIRDVFIQTWQGQGWVCSLTPGLLHTVRAVGHTLSLTGPLGLQSFLSQSLGLSLSLPMIQSLSDSVCVANPGSLLWCVLVWRA